MRTKIIAVLLLLSVALGGVLSVVKIRQDRESPVISIPEVRSYSMGVSDEELLQGVTAEDGQDGDVTDSLRIESVYKETEEEMLTVIYVAKDSSNNVAKCQRSYTIDQSDSDQNIQDQQTTVETASTVPQIILTTNGLELPVGSVFNALDYVKEIIDDKDTEEDLWTRINVTGQIDTNIAGQYQVEYYVVDSDGNQSPAARLTVSVL